MMRRLSFRSLLAVGVGREGADARLDASTRLKRIPSLTSGSERKETYTLALRFSAQKRAPRPVLRQTAHFGQFGCICS